jgi:hypothetical protein
VAISTSGFHIDKQAPLASGMFAGSQAGPAAVKSEIADREVPLRTLPHHRESWTTGLAHTGRSVIILRYDPVAQF